MPGDLVGVAAEFAEHDGAALSVGSEFVLAEVNMLALDLSHALVVPAGSVVDRARVVDELHRF